MLLEDKIYLEQLKGNYQTVEEGFIAGLAAEFGHTMRDMAAISDLFHQQPDKAIARIKVVLAKFRKTLSRIDLDPNAGSNNTLLKLRHKSSRWRYYYFLNDQVYKRVLADAKSGKKMGNIDVQFKAREIPEIYEAKSTDQLIKIVDKYEKRVNEVYNLYKKDEENKGLKRLIQQGLFGLRDLVTAIHMTATYKAK